MGPFRAAEHVHHDGGGRGHAGRAERQIGDRAEMLLELARDRALDREMAGVENVRRAVHEAHAAVAGLEHLDGEHAGHVDALGDRAADMRGLSERLRAGDRRGGEHLRADSVALHGL